ncbi:hypothetical protein WMF27_24340 [Sorangium sp. So ce281]|uniref:hypothetical protein n=1 Tax=unclassified Sorangium TaxID=2621164 RepID=UPI003F5FEC64
MTAGEAPGGGGAGREIGVRAAPWLAPLALVILWEVLSRLQIISTGRCRCSGRSPRWRSFRS